MTAHTPIYGLEYIEQGEPLRNARLALENSMKKVETALSLGGVAAPGATDLLTLAGRVSTIENSSTGWTDLPLVGGTVFTHDGSNPHCRYHKENGQIVRLRGWGKVGSSGVAVNGQLWGALPAAFRPLVTESVWAVRASTGAMVRIDVSPTDGSAISITALSAGEYINLGTAVWPLG